MTETGLRSERLKHVAHVAFSSVDKKSIEGETAVRLCNYTDVYYNGQITADLPFMEGTASLEQIRAFGLQAGDVLITKDSETANDIGVPAFVPETLDGVVCGYHLAVIRPSRDRIVPKYLFWCMNSTLVREQMSVLASGVTRFGLRFGDITNLRIPVPDLVRQQAAARFLDRETARIDDLIVRKSQVRDLLSERWQGEVRSLITGAGNDEDHVDHGERVPWLGRVNVEWGVRRLGHLVRFFSGTTFPHNYQGQTEGDYPFVKVADLALGDGVHVHGAESWVSQDVAGALRARIVPRGSILYPRVGAALLLNQRRIAGRDVIVDDNLRGLKFHRGDPVFWQAVLSLLDLGQFATPGLVPSIGEDAVAAIPVPCPPDDEQTVVASALQERRSKYVALHEALERQLFGLRRHRQALITTAIASQIHLDGLAV